MGGDDPAAVIKSGLQACMLQTTSKTRVTQLRRSVVQEEKRYIKRSEVGKKQREDVDSERGRPSIDDGQETSQRRKAS